jgi:hypothetical protein
MGNVPDLEILRSGLKLVALLSILLPEIATRRDCLEE